MFLFQAGDGIRGGRVTGVQTCALPIYFRKIPFTIDYKHQQIRLEDDDSLKAIKAAGAIVPITVKRDGDSTDVFMPLELRSEERRVGKECGSGMSQKA